MHWTLVFSCNVLDMGKTVEELSSSPLQTLRDAAADNRYLCLLEKIERGSIFFLNEEITKVEDYLFLHKCGEDLGNAQWFSRFAVPTPFRLSVQRDYTRLISAYDIYADCTVSGGIEVFISTTLILEYLAKL